MMRNALRFLTVSAIAAVLALAPVADAASLSPFTGPAGTNPAQNPTILGDLNALINAINTGVTPQTMAPGSNYRNYLDNGAQTIAQRGTSAVTGGTTSGCPLTTYVADRWCVDTNVGSGAGKAQVITSSPTPPAGFQNAVKVWRDSGALTQPVCYIQEIPTSESVQLQNQQVVFSAYLAALSGLTSASNAVVVSIVTGTGTDEGLQTLTASPAITPAFTGVATAGTATFSTTTTFTRYVSAPITIASTVKEIAVELCFTPVGSASGTTDGFAVTGLQLEPRTGPCSGVACASAFEFRPKGVELAKAQQYYFRFSEISGVPLNGFCQATGANTNSCTLALPQPMWSAPTITITTAGTFKVNIAGSLTTISSPTAGTCGVTACIVTAANTNTAGQVEQLTGAAGATGVWEVSKDF